VTWQVQTTTVVLRMNKNRLTLSVILVVIMGVGCSGFQATPNPSASPSADIPTVIAMTIQAGHVDVPTSTSVGTPADFPPIAITSPREPVPSTNPDRTTPLALTQTPTLSPSFTPTSTPNPAATYKLRPTRTPTITPTPTTPVAGVQFVMPGPMSKVASPLHLIANLRSVPSGSYLIELWIEPLQEGGEPRLLYKELQRIISNPVNWVYLDQEIQFELSRVAEYGQLRISTFDTYGRLVSINSVDLILLQMGLSSITPAGEKTEPIVIHQPTPNQLIQGGSVIVSGIVKPTQDFLLVELVTADGAIVGYRQVFVEASADGSYVPYAIEVPYQVESGTWVRMRVSESNVRIAGMEHLTSVEVYLSP
jgi:hypothetical protein